MKIRCCAIGFVCFLAAAARAQTVFPEIEPNETKAQATAANCMVLGDSLSGTTTGASTTVAGAASADTFLVTICAQAQGIYEHRLTLTTVGPVGHTGTIRGLNQSGTAGVGGTPGTIDTEVQLQQTTPARYSVFYGFGAQCRLYYRVTGTATTTAPYVSTLTSTPVNPVNVGAYQPGQITITTIGQGHTTDTELFVYDGNLSAIASYGNDDAYNPASGLQSRLIRTYAAGTYYLAVTQYNLTISLPAASDDNWVTGPLADFPDFICHGINSETASLPVNFSISDGATTTPVTASIDNGGNAHEIAWFTFTVGTPVVFTSFCSNGTLGVDHTTPCPCGNAGLVGNGCAHSFDANGANLSATGTAAADNVLLTSSFEPATSFTLFMQHDSAGDVVFHDGVLCAGGTLIRLRGRAAAGGQAFFPNPVWDSSITLSQRGGVFPGQGVRRYYAAWYRNASTTFCPPATANVTNGWMIDW